MALKRLANECARCPKKSTCQHKRMECVGMLEDAATPVAAPIMADIAVKHDYREVKVAPNTTVTIDLEDLKRQRKEKRSIAVPDSWELYEMEVEKLWH